MISNIINFRKIIQSASSKWDELGKNSIKGYAINKPLKLERVRQGLICIVFCGVYLEALFVLIGRKKYVKYDKYYDKLIYEAKLELFGCSDINIISKCTQFRKARNEIVHEHAEDVKDIAKCGNINKEVDNAIELINLIDSHFGVKK